MGFEILPIEDGEIDILDPIYDIFEITSSNNWVPARFRSINLNTSESMTEPSTLDPNTFLDTPEP